jgi:hypothetical protein
MSRSPARVWLLTLMNFFSRFFLTVVGSLGGWAERSGSVLFAEYPLAKDLSGTDLTSLLDKTKEEVGAIIAPLAECQRMNEKRMTWQSITAKSGQVADEVHYFPNLSQGVHGNYTFLFKDGALVGLSCISNPERAPNKPSFDEKALIDKISQASFDELHEILGAQAGEDSYNRWVKDGAIRVCDIWDVFTHVPSMVVVDWRASSEEIVEDLTAVEPDLVLDPDITYDQLEAVLHRHNQDQKERKLFLFGGGWNEGDSVQIISVEALDAEKLVSNRELAALFHLL